MRRNKEVDMSPDAIDRRLRDLAGLYRLGMSLKEAVYIGPVEEGQSNEGAKPVSDSSPHQDRPPNMIDQSRSE
jgi:hypothetical protein